MWRMVQALASDQQRPAQNSNIRHLHWLICMSSVEQCVGPNIDILGMIIFHKLKQKVVLFGKLLRICFNWAIIDDTVVNKK